MDDEHHQRSCRHQEYGRHIQFKSSFLQGCEESGTDLYSKSIDEQYESEVLHYGQHVRIDREPEMSGNDAGKEDEGGSQADAEYLDLAQTKSGCADCRYDQYGLYECMLSE